MLEQARKCIVFATGSVEAADRIASLLRTGEASDTDLEAVVKESTRADLRQSLNRDGYRVPLD